MKCWTIGAGLAAIGLAAVPASAHLLAYEGFGYTDGSDIHNASGGTGWSTDWANQDTANNAAALTADANVSLTYSTLPTTAGSAFSATSDRVNPYSRQFDLGDHDLTLGGGGQIWISGLFKRSANASGWGISLNSVGTGNVAGVGFGSDNGDTWVSAVIQGDEGADPPAVSPTRYEQDDVVFVVARASATSTNPSQPTHPTVDVWVNPSLDADLSSVPVGGGDSTANRSWSGFAGISYVTVYTHQNNAIHFDEIRVGTTQNDIMPVPEPAALSLAAGGALMLIGRRRRP